VCLCVSHNSAHSSLFIKSSKDSCFIYSVPCVLQALPLTLTMLGELCKLLLSALCMQFPCGQTQNAGRHRVWCDVRSPTGAGGDSPSAWQALGSDSMTFVNVFVCEYYAVVRCDAVQFGGEVYVLHTAR
jgi:hypothetical protein